MEYRTIFTADTAAHPGAALVFVCAAAVLLTLLCVVLCVKRKHLALRIVTGIPAAVLLIAAVCNLYMFLHFRSTVLLPYRRGETQTVCGVAEGVKTEAYGKETAHTTFRVQGVSFEFPDTFGTGPETLPDEVLAAGKELRITYLPYGAYWNIILTVEAEK